MSLFYQSAHHGYLSVAPLLGRSTSTLPTVHYTCAAAAGASAWLALRDRATAPEGACARPPAPGHKQRSVVVQAGSWGNLCW